jgi:hypothetical protein
MKKALQLTLYIVYDTLIMEGKTMGLTVPDDLIIYHYTSASTIERIIETQSIRASCLAYLNDSTEVAHGLELMIKWAEKKYEELHDVNRETKEFDDESAENWLTSVTAANGILGNARKMDVRNLFGVCMSKNGDVLSQWRGYADQGRGYCIGFAALELFEALNVFEKWSSHVWYDEAPFIENLEQIVDKPRKLITFPAYYKVVYTLVGGIKHKSFEEEGEVRFVVPADCNRGAGKSQCGDDFLDFDKDVQFFARNGVLIPFVDLKLKSTVERLPIKQVIVGPGVPHKENAKASVEMLLRKKEYEVSADMVSISQVPFIP